MTQHHPVALRVMIEEFPTESYWILLDFDDAIGQLLHRWCTRHLIHILKSD